MQNAKLATEFLQSSSRVLTFDFGAEGFEPPTYCSQSSRASQAALCSDFGKRAYYISDYCAKEDYAMWGKKRSPR